MQGEDIDFESRELCPDDNCIGTLGANGRCSACGTVAGESAPEVPPSPEEATEWADRELCPDENCIGVVGAGGLCGECGREGRR